ncbi:MAG: L-threonylcarbamoyladenylate synthase [Bacteroidota bacterium]
MPTIIDTNIQRAADILKAGGLVAIPTETVYGLAANIYDENAIQKIFALKQRPLFNPLIVHIHALEQLPALVQELPSNARALAARFWPGSLTLILPKKQNIPDVITAGKDTVGIRMPHHPLALSLLRKLDFPLAAPSANPFTAISPTRPEHVKQYFDGRLQMVLDGGACRNGIESTIIGFDGDTPILYRLGAVAVADIEAVVGRVEVRNHKEVAPDAPGMLAKHYAPRTPTYLVDDVAQFIKDRKEQQIGAITFQHPTTSERAHIAKVLSARGDLQEAAARLYAILHELDSLSLDIIVAERLPDHGLGQSINDRLGRATKK